MRPGGMVTGSNIFRKSPAYGDGVDDNDSTRSESGTKWNSQSSTHMGGGGMVGAHDAAPGS